MTMPHLMNCAHQDDSWCLKCVSELGNKEQEAREALARCVLRLKQYAGAGVGSGVFADPDDFIRDVVEGAEKILATIPPNKKHATQDEMPVAQHTGIPPLFSRWRYRKNPKRQYRVIAIANIAHQSDAHPITVVYQTEGYPDRIWTREIADFCQAFTGHEGG